MMRLSITLPTERFGARGGAGNFSGGCGGRTTAWWPAGNNWLSSPGYLAAGAGLVLVPPLLPPTTTCYWWAGPWRLVLASTNKQQRHSNARDYENVRRVQEGDISGISTDLSTAASRGLRGCGPWCGCCSTAPPRSSFTSAPPSTARPSPRQNSSPRESRTTLMKFTINMFESQQIIVISR